MCALCVCVCAVEFRVGRFSAELVGARASDSHGVSRGTWSRITFLRKRRQRGRRRKVSLEENRSQAPRSRVEKRSSCQKLFSLEEEGEKVFRCQVGVTPPESVVTRGVVPGRKSIPCGKCQITDLRGGLCSEQRKSNKARKKIKRVCVSFAW